MNLSLPEYRFFAALALVVIVTVLAFESPAGPLALLLLVIVAAVLHLTGSWPDRGLYLTCAGMPLVIACSMANFWAGLVAICLLAVLLAEVFCIARTKDDRLLLAAFAGSSLAIALVIHLANHVLIPLVIIMGMTALVLAIQSVRTYQLRKQYAGA